MSYPFDLERALKGDAVVTRRKKRVFSIEWNTKGEGGRFFPLMGTIDGEAYSWRKDGSFSYFPKDESHLDLFMLNPSPDADNS